MYRSFSVVGLFLLSSAFATTYDQSRLFKSIQNNDSQPQHFFELTHPLLTDPLTPSCAVQVLRHDFANTYGLPPVSVRYSPPHNCQWSHAVLEFNASSRGEQYDRIVGVWLAGSEILRTSTAEPNDDGIFWMVRKDVTRYSPLLVQSNQTLSVMLENIVDHVYTGVYRVNITFFFYQVNSSVIPLIRLPRHQNELDKDQVLEENDVDNDLGFKFEKYVEALNNLYNLNTDSFYGRSNLMNTLYNKPADSILPISGEEGKDFWFRIEEESDVHCKDIRIPNNTYRAVLEVYVSSHGNDEFWYSNPPDLYIETNNLTTPRGHGAFREVWVLIDGNLVGSVLPFPVIFTGGINPLFWEPVVGIGAFDLPSYEFDLTPFLGILLDDKVHSLGLAVADGISYWLIDANLHLWSDHNSSKVHAEVVNYKPPSLVIQRYSVFKHLDGSFRIKAKRSSKFSGWVSSTAGIITTDVTQRFQFNNLVKFKANGTYKVVQQRVKAKSSVKVASATSGMAYTFSTKKRYPLSMQISTTPGSEEDVYVMSTNISHGLTEKTTNGGFKMSLTNVQKSSGWMSVKRHAVLSGSTNTLQQYGYRDNLGIYSRVITTADGKIVSDIVR